MTGKIKITTYARGSHNRTKGMELNGNLLTGDTFSSRSQIKDYLDGKWDAGRKGWIIDVDKLMNNIDAGGFFRRMS